MAEIDWKAIERLEPELALEQDNSRLTRMLYRLCINISKHGYSEEIDNVNGLRNWFERQKEKFV